jgi:glycosyltransferase involved in cell wall biosynthesis
MLFVANFKWMQNVEAAKILLDEVYPFVHKKDPSVKVWIVGQHIPAEIIQRRTANILIDDLKEDDKEGIRKAYYEASVFVSPLKGPGGTRLKHFGAMAAKLPLITTTVGAEGLGAKDDREVIVENEPENIAKAVLKVLNDPEFAASIANNARDLVERKYSWYRMAEYLDKIYEETKNEKNKTPIKNFD